MLWSAYLRPVALGGTTTLVSVVGVSMEPRIQTGDLAVVRPETEYEIGDVIAFRPRTDARSEPSLIVHRIVEMDSSGRIRVQGDNNDRADPWTVRHEDVIGRMRWRVPVAGWAIRALHALRP